MTETLRLLLLLGLAGSAVTFLGSAVHWALDEDRRIPRALARVMKVQPDVVAVARGRGRGAGLAIEAGVAAVAWDAGTWCLLYRLEEILGAELVVDGQVLARVLKDQPRRTLDQVVSTAGRVTLRLIFDDPRHPDFDLDLWLAGDERRRDAGSPAEAIQEANSWLARVDAVLRRPVTRPAPIVAQPEPEEDAELFDDTHN